MILALLGTRLAGQLPATHPQADPVTTVLVMIAATTFLFGLLWLLSGMLLAKGGLAVMFSSGGRPRICPCCCCSGPPRPSGWRGGLRALSPGDPAVRWSDVHRIGWGSLGRMMPDMLSVAFIVSLGTLMNASAIEATIGREIDFNRDLKTVGLANLLAARGGSPAGFHSLSATALPQHMGVRGRSAGLISSLPCLAALLGGQGLVNQIPYAISGGPLLFLGLSLLGNWLAAQRVFLSATEYSILLVMLAAGWMAAIIFGLILAKALFIFDNSRISTIRLLLTGRTRRCNGDRDDAKTKDLERYGNAILILCLQGHLFFCTAHDLLRTTGRHLQYRDHKDPHRILIGMKRGSGIDASAINTFSRIRKLCDSFSFEPILTAPSRQILHALQTPMRSKGEGIDCFQDLDHGLEYRRTNDWLFIPTRCPKRIMESIHS